MRTSIKIFIAGAALALIVFLVDYGIQRHSIDFEHVGQALATATTSPQKSVARVVTPNVPPTTSSITSPLAHAEPVVTTSVTFPTATVSIEGKVFDAAVHENENVFDIMNTLKTEGALSFTAREYVGMGAMLLSINGKASNGDLTWIFYVNGKESQKGVSSVKVSPGDVIEWKYEKAY